MIHHRALDSIRELSGHPNGLHHQVTLILPLPPNTEQTGPHTNTLHCTKENFEG